MKTAVFHHIQQIRELQDGYAFRFPGSDEWVSRLAAFINFERHCCPFLHFDLHFEPERGPFRLKVRGRNGVKMFIRTELALLNKT